MSLYLDESGQRVNALSGAADPAVLTVFATGTEAQGGASRVVRAVYALASIASGDKITLTVKSTAARASSTAVASIVEWDGVPITNGVPIITLAGAGAGVVAVDVANFGAFATGARTLELLVQIY